MSKLNLDKKLQNKMNKAIQQNAGGIFHVYGNIHNVEQPNTEISLPNGKDIMSIIGHDLINTLGDLDDPYFWGNLGDLVHQDGYLADLFLARVETYNGDLYHRLNA